MSPRRTNLARLARAAWGLAGLAALLFVLRGFVGDLYRIESGSMRPTLWDTPADPDRVLVTFGGAHDLERFELVVRKPEDESEPFVKRAVGLPGERVQLVDGDLWIGGRMLPPEVPRPEPVLLFDPARCDWDEFFAWNDEVRSFWKHTDGELELDPRARPVGTYSPSLRENTLLQDAYLDSLGKRSGGSAEVGDLILATDLWVEERRTPGRTPGDQSPCGTLRLTLTERGDAFHCIAQYVPGAIQLRLARDERGIEAELESIEISVTQGGWQELELANVDNVLSVTWNGERVLVHAYAQNSEHIGATGSHQVHRKPRVALAGHGKDPLRLRDLRVARDLHYTARGTFATHGPLDLGPDEYFLLGDNSSASRDGREWGPVRADELVGRVRAVVWPWHRRHWISGP